MEPADYPRWRESRLGALTERIEQRAISELCGDVSGRRVLDLGCGDGTYALRASREGSTAVGIDISPAMLRAAALRSNAHWAQPGWCQGSGAVLPFGANVFDVVLAVTVLCFAGNPESTIREAARVLRPGGWLVIGELGRYSSWALYRRVRGWLGSKTWRLARFWSVEALRRLVEASELRFNGARSCVYYPPAAFLAGFLGPLDPFLSRLGEFGAAFIAVKAVKP